MPQCAPLLAVGALLLWLGAAAAQELVHFPSLADNEPGNPPITLDRMFSNHQPRDGILPIFMHGCGGLFDRNIMTWRALA